MELTPGEFTVYFTYITLNKQYILRRRNSGFYSFYEPDPLHPGGIRILDLHIRIAKVIFNLIL